MPTNSKHLRAESELSPDSATVRFNKGPNIAVTVFIEGGQISSSSLALSDSFICTGANEAILKWIEAYAEKKSPPFFLQRGSYFLQNVLKHLSRIPFGKTISYQELAAACGTPKGARAVGNACGKNPFPLFVPCHRVIRSNGGLGGFALDIEIKRRLLEFEAS